MKIEPIVLVHGGAGDIPNWRVPLKLNGVQEACRAGYEALRNGNVLDAVAAAIRVMEDDTAFNAGQGSVLTLDGTVEMDAIIMEGTTLKAGAVASITNVQYPIDVARLVMEKTPHVLLVGKGATDFAHREGVPFFPDEELITEYAKEALEEFIRGKGAPTNELGGTKEAKYGTVGAVAIDADGNMACATSTGGMTGKMPGRAGDTPIVGAGGYCDNNAGAVSATGVGEAIMRVCLSRHITDLMKTGKNPTEAVKEALLYMKERTGADAGCIALSKTGEVGFYFTSKRMAWAYQKGSEVHYGIEHGEQFQNTVE